MVKSWNYSLFTRISPKVILNPLAGYAFAFLKAISVIDRFFLACITVPMAISNKMHWFFNFYWDKGIVRALLSWDLSINNYDDPPPRIKKVQFKTIQNLPRCLFNMLGAQSRPHSEQATFLLFRGSWQNIKTFSVRCSIFIFHYPVPTVHEGCLLFTKYFDDQPCIFAPFFTVQCLSNLLSLFPRSLG